MTVLKVPAKYKRVGLKVKCLKCKYQVSERCGETANSIATCQHKDKHRFNLVVCVPGSPGARRTKILDTTNLETALTELSKFREECKRNNYHKSMVQTTTQQTTITAFATAYLDTISGQNTPTFLIRQRSEEHIGDCRRVISRFCISLKKRGYNIGTLDLKDIHDEQVQVFHEFLLEELKLGQTTYNKHFVIMKTFFNWVIKVKDYDISNPFRHAELRYDKREKNIVNKEEFEKLLSVITPENGYIKIKNKRRNLYRPWLVNALKLALETGLRTEELVVLRWSHIVDLGNDVLIFKISNLKVNRIQTGESVGKYVKHIPITQSLMKLLMGMGYDEKKNSDGYIIERTKSETTKYMMVAVSRGFNHYIKLATERDLKFKDLRKTYITHITLALGDKAKLFTGHSNDEVLINHYLSGAYLAGSLCKFNMF